MKDEPMSMENYRRIMAKAEEDIAKLRAGLPMPNADRQAAKNLTFFERYGSGPKGEPLWPDEPGYGKTIEASKHLQAIKDWTIVTPRGTTTETVSGRLVSSEAMNKQMMAVQSMSRSMHEALTAGLVRLAADNPGMTWREDFGGEVFLVTMPRLTRSIGQAARKAHDDLFKAVEQVLIDSMSVKHEAAKKMRLFDSDKPDLAGLNEAIADILSRAVKINDPGPAKKMPYYHGKRRY